MVGVEREREKEERGFIFSVSFVEIKPQAFLNSKSIKKKWTQTTRPWPGCA